jgi:hypothetical protein
LAQRGPDSGQGLPGGGCFQNTRLWSEWISHHAAMWLIGRERKRFQTIPFDARLAGLFFEKSGCERKFYHHRSDPGGGCLGQPWRCNRLNFGQFVSGAGKKLVVKTAQFPYLSPQMHRVVPGINRFYPAMQQTKTSKKHRHISEEQNEV